MRVKNTGERRIGCFTPSYGGGGEQLALLLACHGSGLLVLPWDYLRVLEVEDDHFFAACLSLRQSVIITIAGNLFPLASPRSLESGICS